MTEKRAGEKSPRKWPGPARCRAGPPTPGRGKATTAAFGSQGHRAAGSGPGLCRWVSGTSGPSGPQIPGQRPVAEENPYPPMLQPAQEAQRLPAPLDPSAEQERKCRERWPDLSLARSTSL